MPREYRLITAGVFAGEKRMKLHYMDIETDQVLCGSYLSGYETQPREGVRVCKRCEAAFRSRGGILLVPRDTDAWLADAYPDLMDDFIEEEVTDQPSVIKAGLLVDNIIGRWSADQLYAPGAMEDIEVAFHPTGDGWLYFDHPFQQIVSRFSWEINNFGFMQIKGTDLEFHDLKVEVTIEFTPRGENEVISFSEPLWLTDRRFALVTRDNTSLEV
ncbi:hypothetical protein A8990_13233 [Paenibacillus taihuensis]|uniref:Uncharacterized protein n=1 Tax=Paenibacillus taihuensis TaxID=1156355 RepID=A0A3D9R3I8_9BACL|nr:hypothetical protein [Paenibacillus taihuensis]REE69636.1 hypothetical protein A8990_13233 [Paenibacillus taihuensis]